MDELTEEQDELIAELGLDFMCEHCGTELTIFDTECTYEECGESTAWSTDCQVIDVIKEINGDCDE